MRAPSGSAARYTFSPGGGAAAPLGSAPLRSARPRRHEHGDAEQRRGAPGRPSPPPPPAAPAAAAAAAAAGGGRPFRPAAARPAARPRRVPAEPPHRAAHAGAHPGVRTGEPGRGKRGAAHRGAQAGSAHPLPPQIPRYITPRGAPPPPPPGFGGVGGRRDAEREHGGRQRCPQPCGQPLVAGPVRPCVVSRPVCRAPPPAVLVPRVGWRGAGRAARPRPQRDVLQPPAGLLGEGGGGEGGDGRGTTRPTGCTLAAQKITCAPAGV